MRTHTPGPWRVIVDDTGGPFTGWPSVRAPEDEDTTVVHRAGFKQEYWGDLSLRETMTNARLIAAAPELLGALKDLLSAHHHSRGDEWVDAAYAAVERAEGKTP